MASPGRRAAAGGKLVIERRARRNPDDGQIMSRRAHHLK